MLALPTTAWRATAWTSSEITAGDGAGAIQAGVVEHVFTHFALSLSVWRAERRSSTFDGEALIWSERTALEGLPSVFLKAARLALTSSD